MDEGAAEGRAEQNYQAGDVLVAHKTTKHFLKGDELNVVRKDKRRLIVQRAGEAISVSLELSFVAHRVTITGRSLTEIYRAVTEAEARLVRVVAADFADAAAVPSHKALVEGIRIEPLDADERRKQ